MRKLLPYFGYNLCLLLLLPFFLLISLRHNLRRRGGFTAVLQRLGLGFSFARVPAGGIWIQALSVGEVTVSRILIAELEKQTSAPIFLTTTTPTGYRTARRIFPHLPVAYFPMDLPWTWSFFLPRLKPGVFVSLETEFWPNLLLNLSGRGIPALLVNGRLSPRSRRRYGKLRPYVKTILDQFRILAMRGEAEAGWIREIGLPGEKVLVTGNLKYDLVVAVAEETRPGSYRLPDVRTIVFGSIHPEEEPAAVDVAEKICAAFPGVRCIFAPRHLERSRLPLIFRQRNLAYQSVSEFPGKLFREKWLMKYLLLDVMGQLNSAYADCSAAFVGGSLTMFGDGGHNVLEPAAFGKPAAFGPLAWNFREECDLLLRAGAAVMTSDSQALYAFFAKCLVEPEWAREAGRKGHDALLGCTGAGKRDADLVRRFLSQGEPAAINKNQ